jgi:hypothetical protein
MPIKLKKRICRETTYSQARKNGRICNRGEMGRPIVVELNPDETITFRVKGTKTRHTLHIMSAFELATVNTVVKAHNTKMGRYKEKKKLGERCKKPKPPFIFYGKSFFTVLK